MFEWGWWSIDGIHYSITILITTIRKENTQGDDNFIGHFVVPYISHSISTTINRSTPSLLVIINSLFNSVLFCLILQFRPIIYWMETFSVWWSFRKTTRQQRQMSNVKLCFICFIEGDWPNTCHNSIDQHVTNLIEIFLSKVLSSFLNQEKKMNWGKMLLFC